MDDEDDLQEQEQQRVTPSEVVGEQRDANTEAQADRAPASTSPAATAESSFPAAPGRTGATAPAPSTSSGFPTAPAPAPAPSRTDALTAAQAEVANPTDFESYRGAKNELRGAGLEAPIRARYSDQATEEAVSGQEQRNVQQRQEQVSRDQERQAEQQARATAQQQAAQGRATAAAGRQQDMAARAQATAATRAQAKAAHGSLEDFKKNGGVTEHDADGNEVPKTQLRGDPLRGDGEQVPVYKPGVLNEAPRQNDDGHWVVSKRNVYGEIEDLPVESSPHFHEDQKTGEQSYTLDGEKIPLGVNQNIVERRKLIAQRGIAAEQEAEAGNQLTSTREDLATAAERVRGAKQTLANVMGRQDPGTGGTFEQRLQTARLTNNQAEMDSLAQDPEYSAAWTEMNAAQGEHDRLSAQKKDLEAKQNDARARKLGIPVNHDLLDAVRDLPDSGNADAGGDEGEKGEAGETGEMGDGGASPRLSVTDSDGPWPADAIKVRGDGSKSLDPAFAEVLASGKRARASAGVDADLPVVGDEAKSNLAAYGQTLEQARDKFGVTTIGEKPIGDEIDRVKGEQARAQDEEWGAQMQPLNELRDRVTAQSQAIKDGAAQSATGPLLTAREKKTLLDNDSLVAAVDALARGDGAKYEAWVKAHPSDVGSVVKQLMADRDNAKAGFLASHFNYGSGDVGGDFLERMDDMAAMSRRKTDDPNASAGAKLLDTAKGALGTVAELVNVATGRTTEDIEAEQRRHAAYQAIGNLNGADAEKALTLASGYREQLEKGDAIVKDGEGRKFLPMSVQDGALRGGLDLGDAQAFLNSLKKDAKSAISTAAAQNFVQKAGTDLAPFVTMNEISVDPKNIEQVAKAHALRDAIDEQLAKYYGISTAAGGAVGTLGSFYLGGLATRLAAGKLATLGALGETLKTASDTVSAEKRLHLISEAANFALQETSGSLKENPEGMGVMDRMLDMSARTGSLYLANELGGKVEKSVLSRVGPQAPLALQWAARSIGSAGSLQSMGVLQDLMAGRNPGDNFLQSGGTNVGIGMALAALGLHGDARAKKAAWAARDAQTDALTAYVRSAGVEASARETALRDAIAKAPESGPDGRYSAQQDGLKSQLMAHMLGKWADIEGSPATFLQRHTEVRDLRAQMETARQDGDGVKVAALKDQVQAAQDKLESSAALMLRSDPERAAKIGKVISPDFDGNGAKQLLEENAPLRTAAVEIGRNMRDLYLPGGRGVGAVRLASGSRDGETGVAQAMVDQLVGVHAVRADLVGVLDGKPIEASKGAALAGMGLLHLDTRPDGTTIYRVTNDAAALMPKARRDAIARESGPDGRAGKFNLKVTGNDPGAVVNHLRKSGEDRLAAAARGQKSEASGRGETGAGPGAATGGPASAGAPGQARQSTSKDGRGAGAGDEARGEAGRFQVKLKVEIPGKPATEGLVSVDAANSAEAAQKAIAQARELAGDRAKVSVTGRPEAISEAEKPAAGATAKIDRAGAGREFSKVFQKWRQDLAKMGITRVKEDPSIGGPMAVVGKDTLVFNRDQLRELVNQRQDPNETPAHAIEGQLVHELIHGAGNQVLSHGEAEDIAATAPEGLVKLARSSYHNFDALTPWQQGHELLRMVVEGRYVGRITEQIYRALQKVLDQLGIQIRKLPENELLKSAADRVKAVLDANEVDISKSKVGSGEERETGRQGEGETGGAGAETSKTLGAASEGGPVEGEPGATGGNAPGSEGPESDEEWARYEAEMGGAAERGDAELKSGKDAHLAALGKTAGELRAHRLTKTMDRREVSGDERSGSRDKTGSAAGEEATAGVVLGSERGETGSERAGDARGPGDRDRSGGSETDSGGEGAESAKPEERPRELSESSKKLAAMDPKALGELIGERSRRGRSKVSDDALLELAGHFETGGDHDRLNAVSREMETRFQAEQLRELAEHQARGSKDLLQAVQDMGGLPLPAKEAVFSGELKWLRESKRGARPGLFNSNARSLDTLRGDLAKHGFEFHSVNDLLAALQGRMFDPNNRPVFGTRFGVDQGGGNEGRLGGGRVGNGAETGDLFQLRGDNGEDLGKARGIVEARRRQADRPGAKVLRAAEPLTLERQTEESIRGDRARAEIEARSAQQRAELERRQSSRLTGSSENVGQGALFAEDSDLFSGKSAEEGSLFGARVDATAGVKDESTERAKAMHSELAERAEKELRPDFRAAAEADGREGYPGLPGFLASKDLTRPERMIEARFAQQIADDPAKALYDYRRLALKEQGTPYYVGADLAREIFPAYGDKDARILLDRASLAPAGYVALKLAWDADLAQANVAKRPEAIFLAGGPASGKTTASRVLDMSRASVVTDSVFGSYESARGMLDQAIGAGLKPRVVLVFRPRDQAAAAALSRLIETGRPTSVDYFGRAHDQAPRNFLRLEEEYRGRADFEVLLNEGRPADIRVGDVDALRARSYALSDESRSQQRSEDGSAGEASRGDNARAEAGEGALGEGNRGADRGWIPEAGSEEDAQGNLSERRTEESARPGETGAGEEASRRGGAGAALHVRGEEEDFRGQREETGSEEHAQDVVRAGRAEGRIGDGLHLEAGRALEAGEINAAQYRSVLHGNGAFTEPDVLGGGRVDPNQRSFDFGLNSQPDELFKKDKEERLREMNGAREAADQAHKQAPPAEGDLFANDYSKQGQDTKAKPERLQEVDDLSGPLPTEKRETGVSDFGEKIGGARKDRARPLGPRAERKQSDAPEGPAWRRKYVVVPEMRYQRMGYHAISEPTPTGRFKIERVDGVFVRGSDTYATPAEAEAAIPLVEVTRNHGVLRKTADEWQIYRRVGDHKHPTVKGGFESAEAAREYMATHPEELIEHKFAFPTRPWLDRLERKGDPVRSGDVTPKMFQEAFGFRGGEFGNWNMGGDGQAALNHAYDALHDFARILGVDPKALSLNGELAIAFGARGTGGEDAASAHYEPGYRVINLTKIKGAGAMAHEWFHGFDHYLGRQDSKAGAAEKAKASGRDLAYVRGEYVSHGFSYKSGVREELRAAFQRVMDTITAKKVGVEVPAEKLQAIVGKQTQYVRETLAEIRRQFTTYHEYSRTKKPATPEQLAEFDRIAEKIGRGDVGERINVDVPGQGRRLSNWRSSFAPIEELNAVYKKVLGRSFAKNDEGSMGKRLFWQIQAMRDAETRVKNASQGAVESRTVATDFLREARKIDELRASDYWSTPHEMGARAFEAFVADRLSESGLQNEYLVHGADNRLYAALGLKPYPEGAERAELHDAWKNLWETIEQRTTDRGVALHAAHVEPGLESEVDRAAGEAATAEEDPSDAQKVAGNYRMGHTRISGLDISIENPAGSTRSGTDGNGKPWSVEMGTHYGYIRGTEGRDGDHVDVMIKAGTPADYEGPVFVVNQVKPGNGHFDEHKAILGARNQAEAAHLYQSNYSPGWKGLGGMREMSMAEFKEWVRNGDTTKPLEAGQRSAGPGEAAPSVAELVKDNMGLAVTIANSYRNIPGADFDNVLGEARKALVMAARGFDPQGVNGAPFGAYAGRSIRNALNSMFNKEGRRAAHEVMSADEPMLTGGLHEEDRTLKGQMADPNATAAVSSGIEGEETRAALAEAMGPLPERVKTVLNLAGEGKSLREIGEAIGLSHEMARRILENGKGAVLARLKERGFTGLDPDNVLHAGRIDPDADRAGDRDRLPGRAEPMRIPRTFEEARESLARVRASSGWDSLVDDVQKLLSPDSRLTPAERERFAKTGDVSAIGDARKQSIVQDGITAAVDRRVKQLQAAVKGTAKLIGKLEPGHRRELMLRVDEQAMGGRGVRLKPGPIADAVHELVALDDAHTREIKATLEAHGMGDWRNYEALERNVVPHSFKDPEAASRALDAMMETRRMEGGKDWLEHRMGLTLRDIVTAHPELELKHDNLADAMLDRWARQERFVGAHDMAAEMERLGTGHWEATDYQPDSTEMRVDDVIMSRHEQDEDFALKDAPADSVHAPLKAHVEKLRDQHEAAVREMEGRHAQMERDKAKWKQAQGPELGVGVEPAVSPRYRQMERWQASLRDQVAERKQRIAELNERLEAHPPARAQYFFANRTAARVLMNYLSRGLRGGHKWVDNYFKAANVLNAAQLGLSAFHAGFVTMEGMVSHFALGIQKALGGDVGGGLRNMVEASIPGVSTWKDLKLGGKIRREMMNPGMYGAAHQGVVDAMVQGGFRDGLDGFYADDHVKKFLQAWKDKAIVPGALQAPMALIEAVAKPIMEFYVPRMKAAAVFKLAEMHLGRADKAGTEMSAMELRKKLQEDVRSGNNRFGQMTYDNLHLHKVVKDLLMGATRSLGWNWGTFSEIGGGLAQWLAAVPKAGKAVLGKGARPEVTNKMAYTLALPMLVGGLGAVVSAMFGQKPEKLKDYFFIKTGAVDEKGNAVRVSLPSYMKDVFHAAKDPTATVTNKLHPIFSTIGQMLENRDFYGTEIRHAGDPVMTQILQELAYAGKQFVPFTGRQFSKQTTAGAPPIVKVGGMLGLTQAPASTGRSDALNLAMEIGQESRPTKTRTSAEAEASAARSRVIALMRNQDPRAGQALQAALQAGTVKAKDMGYIQRMARMTALQAAVNNLGLNDAERVLEKATPGEKQELAGIIARKREKAGAVE